MLNCIKVGNERISIRAKFPQIREQNYEKEMPFFLNMSPQQMQEFKAGLTTNICTRYSYFFL